jgi:hypothetical protein
MLKKKKKKKGKKKQNQDGHNGNDYKVNRKMQSTRISSSINSKREIMKEGAAIKNEDL